MSDTTTRIEQAGPIEIHIKQDAEGRRHSLDGPAVLMTQAATGKIYAERWFIEGVEYPRKAWEYERRWYERREQAKKIPLLKWLFW